MRLKAVYNKVPADVRLYLSMILNPLTSTALVATSCIDKSTCLDNTSIQIALLRKLRFPLWLLGAVPRCHCSKVPDMYGDHFFACKKCHKTRAHNQIKNTLHLIFQELSLITGLCYTKHKVRLEAKRLLKCYPQKLPLDIVVGLYHQQVYEQADRSGRQVVVTRVDAILVKFDPLPDCDDPQKLAKKAVGRHQLKERAKLRGAGKKDSLLQTKIQPEDYMVAVNKADEALILFTVDAFGSVGPMARTLLFGDAPADPPQQCKAFSPQAQLTHDNATVPAAFLGLLPQKDRL